MAGNGLDARGALGAALMVLVALGGDVAIAAGGTGHEASAEPVPTGEELVERCRDHREVLEFTRAQLRERTVLGRLNLLRREHRERERFVDAHCEDVGRHES
ncbi:MAG: hypothetical protein U5R48_02560 [Gammaproteobacteria bacterium]|nr:hypothetical protein [Gammaproteobacteria bacterium]